MAENGYTLKLTRAEINEIATALTERREKLQETYKNLHPDDSARNGYMRTLNTIDNLRQRIG